MVAPKEPRMVAWLHSWNQRSISEGPLESNLKNTEAQWSCSGSGSGNVAGVTCRGRCQLVWKKVSGMSLAQIGFTRLPQAPGTALVQRVVSVTEVATEASLRGCLKRLLRDQWGRLHVSEIKKMIRALKSKVVMLWVPVYGFMDFPSFSDISHGIFLKEMARRLGIHRAMSQNPVTLASKRWLICCTYASKIGF